MRRHQHRVDRELRLRAVPATAGDDDRELGRMGHDGPSGYNQVGNRPRGPVVVAVDLVDAVETFVAHHRLGAAGTLLCGLEQEAHAAATRQRPRAPAQQRGRTDQRRHVSVVAAEVRDTLVLGAIRQPVVALGHPQRVHVRTQRDRCH